jgi:WD40 repeat protein
MIKLCTLSAAQPFFEQKRILSAFINQLLRRCECSYTTTSVPDMNQGTKRARAAEPDTPTTHAAQPSAGRPQLLLVKTELQSWLGKKYCDEADLLGLLLAHSLVRRVHTIAVEVRPLGGDSFKVALDARRPLVSEAKVEIARLQGTREGKQELYKVATRADGGAVREDDAAPELLDDEDIELRDGEIVAMAVKTAFEPLLAEEERTLAGHTAAVRCMVVHGDKLISSSYDNTIKVWSTGTWTCERTLEGHTEAVCSMVVHGGKLLSGSNDNTIKVWSTDTWVCERTGEGHPDWVFAFAMYGDKLISGSFDGTIKVWSTDTWACEHTLDGHDEWVRSLLVHGDRLLSGSTDHTIKVWSTDTWTCERTLEGHTNSVWSLAVHGDKMISGSKDNTIKVWSTDTWACEHTLEGHTDNVSSLVMHGDKMISGSKDTTIKVWSTDTWACERTLGGHDDIVSSLVVHGDKLLSGSGDHAIKVWGS